MAKIHRSKDHLGADVRSIRVRYVIGWIGRVLVALLMIAAYVAFWKQLRAWGDQLAAAYHAWAVAPMMAERIRIDNEWLQALRQIWEILVHSAETAVRLAPLMIPAIAAGVAMWLCRLLMGPMMTESFKGLRAGVEGERYALTLARRMPRSCHVFVNKYIPNEGQWAETDLILVGPGGVAVVEVKNWSGQVQGDASDDKVTRSGGRTHYNPVRQVNTHVYKLKKYLRGKGVNVWVVPCVVFVHPRAKVEITGVADVYTQDERGTVVVTAKDFQSRIAQPLETGSALSREEIDKIVRAIKAAPAKPPET